MNRNALLYEITGIAGDVFKELEAKGIEIPDRYALAFNAEFCRRWLALPAPDAEAVKLADAVLENERNHGGLLGRETFKLAAVVKRG